MSGRIPAFTIVLDSGEIGPAFPIEVAMQAAREAEQAGRTALRIRQGAKIVLEGVALREALDDGCF